MQPLNCASQEGTPRTRAQGWEQMGSWAVPGPGLHLSSELCPISSRGPSATGPHWLPLCPLARGILDRRLYPPPLQQHTPGRRARPLAHQLPTTQRDRVCQGQCWPPPAQHGLKPGAAAVLVVVVGRGRGVLWCGGLWKEGSPGAWTCPVTPTPHLSMYLCSDHIAPHPHASSQGHAQMHANIHCRMF